MVLIVSSLSALLLLLLVLKLSQRLTLRLKVLAGVTLSRQPQKSCPHLGIASDPFNHGPNPSDDHRCYLYMQRDRIDLLHQKSFCLSTAHHHCPWLMIRRPDAPPPLSKRLPNLVGGFPRAAWSGVAAFARLLPRAGATLLPGLRVAGSHSVRFAGGLGHVVAAIVRGAGRGLDRAVGFTAHALMHVAADFGAALVNVGRDVAHSGIAGKLFVGLVQVLWFVVRAPFRVGSAAVMACVHVARSMAARRQVRLAAVAAAAPMPATEVAAAPEAAPIPETALAHEPAVLPADLQELLNEAFPGLDSHQAPVAQPTIIEQEEPALAAPTFAAAAEPVHLDELDVVSERLKAPLARFEELVSRLEELVNEGVNALDRGQDSLAYELFLKATQQPANLVDKAAGPELRTQHSSLMTRAWFWRAKTAETVEEVVQTLEQALRYDPGNLQIEAHLAWARQRLEREQRLERPTEQDLKPPTIEPTQPSRGSRVVVALGEAVRLVGGLAALALAALWMTTALLPALSRVLASLSPADQVLVKRFVLTLNATALPGQGHLPLPMLNYDLGLSLPFVMAFAFVFTARGLMEGDNWARTTGLLLAGVGGWLCAAAVTNPDAGRLGLALCVGIIVAAVIGRFDSPKVMPRVPAGY